jgi:hypothetical protein
LRRKAVPLDFADNWLANIALGFSLTWRVMSHAGALCRKLEESFDKRGEFLTKQ